MTCAWSSAVMASGECSITESQKRQRTLDCPGANSMGAPQLGQRRDRGELGSDIGFSFRERQHNDWRNEFRESGYYKADRASHIGKALRLYLSGETTRSVEG